MRNQETGKPIASDKAAETSSHPTIAELVGEVYESAPPSWRCRMLEHLMQPLGALALVGVCNGIFAKIWFRTGMQELIIGPDDARGVSSVDVVSLANFVQQASADTINNLTALLSNSPMIVYSTAAAMLVSILLQRSRRSSQTATRDTPDNDPENSPD